MKVPTKVLFASYLPKVKDRDKILMARSGTNVGGNPPMRNLITSLPTGYLDNLDQIGQGATNGTPFPNYTPQGGADPNSLYPQRFNPYTGPSQGSSDQMQPDTSNYHPAGPVQGFPQGISTDNFVNPVIDPNKPLQTQPYEGQVGKGIVTAAAAFDAFLPYGRITRWPRIQPQITPNQHPYGTGSQAIMREGGVLLLDSFIDQPRARMDNGGELAFFDGIRDMDRARLENGGGITLLDSFIDLDRARMPNGGNVRKAPANPYGNRYVAFPYSPNGGMSTTNTVDLNSATRMSAVNPRGYVNAYNTIDQYGNKGSLNDEQIPYQYINGKNTNNRGIQTIGPNGKTRTDSVYVAPGANDFGVHLPMAWGGTIREEAASGIHIKPSHRGRFTAYKKRTGQTTEEALHSKNPHVRQMANFARNAKKWHKGADGAELEAYNPNLADHDLQFQSWYAKNTMEGKKGMPYSGNGDYDYYSFYRNGGNKASANGHFPDTYKRTNHQTFSDESIYSTPEHKGGHWQGDKFIPQAKDGHWIQHAINPKHKGYCTPMTKSTCTGHRKAFAERAKHHNLEAGGAVGMTPALATPAGLSGTMMSRNTSPIKAGASKKHRKGYGGKMPNGGTTRGLVPEPTYNFAAGTTPNGSDSSMYLSNFNKLSARDPTAMQWYNQLNMYGVPASVSPDARTLAINQYNAYQDAAGKNVMTDQQVHNELTRPFAKPKDVPSRKKFAKGGGLSRAKDYGSKSHPYAMVKSKDFAGPHRSYPIPTKADAADALKLAHLHHKPGVIAKVHKKYPNLKSGGSLTPSKAAEILHDGTAQGHPLTDKQRRFFGWKSHQTAPNGTLIPNTAQNTLNQANPTGERFTPQSRGDAYMVDAINQMMVTGQMSTYKGNNPQERAIMNDAYVWRQANGQRNNGQQNMEGYFNRPVNPNNPTDYYRGRLAHIGQGAVSMYNTTPSLDVQTAKAPTPMAPPMASMLYGGSMAFEGGGQIFKGGPVQLEHDPNYFANGGNMSYADGGGINTHWGGNAEPIAYNPYDGGTTQFHGDSHAEGGIGMSYNGKQVEVEGGETAAKDSEGNLNIFGNMRVPGTNVKFKTASKEIAEKEQKFDKLKTNGTATVNALDPKNKYEQIEFNAGQIMMQGGDMGQKKLAESKQKLADLQNAMLDTAEAHNLDPEGMSKGNLKKAKKGMFVKKYPGGGKIKNPFLPDSPPPDYNPNANTPNYYSQYGNSNAPTYQPPTATTSDVSATVNDETMSDRNNNMGNIKFYPNTVYGKLLMKKYGAVQGDKTTEGDYVARFPTPEAGREAAKNLLFSGTKYKGQTLNAALTDWTGKKPYDLSGLGNLGKMKVSDIPVDQREHVLDYMKRGEGTKYGTPKTTSVPIPDTPTHANPNVNVKFGLPPTGAFTPDPKTVVPDPAKVPERSLDNIPTRRNIPTQAKPLGFNDVASDIFAIAQNQERPVYAQRYTPELYQPYQVSFQDRLNDNQASFNEIQRLTGSNNPTALGALAGQKYSADNAVRADEFRQNQGISNQVYNENIGLVNDAQWKNLGLAANQADKQALANSKTREMNQVIANDISTKYNQVQYRNNELRAYENLYNYRLQPNQQTGGLDETNYNPLFQGDYSGMNGTGQGGGPDVRKITNYNPNGTVKNYRTVQNSELTTENLQQILDERKRKNEDYNTLKFFHGGNVRKYKPVRL